MYVAVDDAGHDKLAAKIGHFALILRETSLVAYIDKFAVFHYQSCCLWICFVRCKYLRVFDDLIYFHNLLLLIDYFSLFTTHFSLFTSHFSLQSI